MIRRVRPGGRVRINPQPVNSVRWDSPAATDLHAAKTTCEGCQRTSITKTEDMREVGE